jgi:hypothetical protein
MNILIRVAAWIEAPGVRAAARNAWRAIEETAEAKAAVDARCRELAPTTARPAPDPHRRAA